MTNVIDMDTAKHPRVLADLETPEYLQAFADKTVVFVGEVMTQQHRGAFHIETGILAIFGNDGYGDPRVMREIDLVVEELNAEGEKILAFSHGEHSWVVLVESDDAESLLDAVVRCWHQACIELSPELQGMAARG